MEYKFETIEKAKEKQAEIDSVMGFPVNVRMQTKHYANIVKVYDEKAKKEQYVVTDEPKQKSRVGLDPIEFGEEDKNVL